MIDSHDPISSGSEPQSTLNDSNLEGLEKKFELSGVWVIVYA